MINKAVKIFLEMIPILLMIGLIPMIKNDFYLAYTYVGIIIAAFVLKRERNEIIIFIAGFFLMILFEAIFISTGVETFNRNSLFGIMPLWLPFLWGYGFVAIKRSARILDTYGK